MTEVQFYEYDSPAPLLPFLKSCLPTAIPIYQRIQSPQNVPERCTLLVASIPPASVPQSWEDELSSSSPHRHITICFADRSRHHESQVWVFNTLSLQATRTEQLSQEKHYRLVNHLRSLFLKIKLVEDSYSGNPIKPLNYPFLSTLRLAALHELLASTIEQDIIKPIHQTVWDQLIFHTPTVKRQLSTTAFLPNGYELGVVPPSQIDLVLSTSTIVRQASTLLQLPNAAVLVDSDSPDLSVDAANGDTCGKRLVAWAFLGIDMGLTTLYVLPKHRGKGLAKIAAVTLLGTLSDGTAGSQKVQCDWCIADVAADNASSQGMCIALGATFFGRSRYMRINLDKVARTV